ncbi:MAG TPA: polyphenol oxidase family protein [Solirubrobacteraceae bacterium]|nr:polyphenol oxidase family protein [Solirubrobacteraceae bacterium]
MNATGTGAPAASSPAGPGALAYELPGGGRALFTTRAHGNLSTGSGAEHEHGLRRRAELCERLGLRWLCSSRQVHGSAVHAIERVDGAAGTPVALDADAHLTELPGVGAMVLAADCVPVALGAPGAVAVVHAGWRGLAAGVLEQAVRALRDRRPGAPVAAIVGPGAGGCCYEVGPEVLAALGLPAIERRPPPSGLPAAPTRVDLRAVARERLLGAGVARVEDVGACTICDERFFSHRREAGRAGRHAAIAWLS